MNASSLRNAWLETSAQMNNLSVLSKSVCESTARDMAGTRVSELNARELGDLWILSMGGYLMEANGVVVEINTNNNHDYE